MGRFNFWRFFAAMMIGFLLGFASGAWFYRAHLDKPTAVVEIGKQKMKGSNNRGTFSNEPTTEVESKEKRGLFHFFKRNEKEDDNE